MAPAYGLPSTFPYGDVTMALALGGKEREDIGRADFVALGERCGVPAKATARVLNELVAAAPAWLERLGEWSGSGASPGGNRRYRVCPQ